MSAVPSTPRKSAKKPAEDPSGMICMDTPNSSLVFLVDKDGFLYHRYFGKMLDTPARIRDFVFEDERRYATFEMPSVFGGYYGGDPAVAVTHADGNMSSDFRYVRHERVRVDDNIIETRIRLKDSAYDFHITICCRAYQAEDMFACRMLFENGEGVPVVLTRFASFELNLTQSPTWWLSHFYGDWSTEMKLEEERLGHGLRIIDSKKGVRTSQHSNASFMLSMGGPAAEETGEVVGGVLAWSGNYRLCFELDGRNILHVNAGINPFASAYHLDSGEQFETPEFIFTHSANGKGAVSRRFHAWARRYALRDGDTPRPVVFNSWEGAYFDFDEKKLLRMMADAAALGVELFVLDDGWFGNKHPRNSTGAGLGDWQVNVRKLPKGLDHLIDRAEAMGMRFGIWVEPEMVNPQSELAETHPDWMLGSPAHERILVRNQLLLDLCNPAVQQFVFEAVDSLLTKHPRISYVKWDCNRHMASFGSAWLAADKQSHLWIAYTRGLYAVYEKLAKRHPNVIFQACGSGGGRVDYGLMPYHHEFWPSDVTDALERVFVQWGTSHFYPAIGMAAHVSAVPNHQTGAVLPLKFRFDVASSGRLGCELQPKDLTESELEFAKRAIANYKRMRDVVATGDLYRLNSPYETDNTSSLMYVLPDKNRAVVFLYLLRYRARFDYPVLRLRGLDPDKKYRLREVNKASPCGCCAGDGKVFNGNFLMNHGVRVEVKRPYDSVVLELACEDV